MDSISNLDVELNHDVTILSVDFVARDLKKLCHLIQDFWKKSRDLTNLPEEMDAFLQEASQIAQHCQLDCQHLSTCY